jgi:Ubiquitin-conjugating enzyme
MPASGTGHTYSLPAFRPCSRSVKASASSSVASSSDELYVKTLQELQFGECSMARTGKQYTHHYASQISAEASIRRTKLKRLIREMTSLRKNMPLSPHSSVFLRVDDDRPDVMQVLITGPTDTPYSFGAFQFDLYCPVEYPSVPPVVNLQTTGNGAVRFNPNLYNVCWCTHRLAYARSELVCLTCASGASCVSVEERERESVCVIYIYIYICTCVCACVCIFGVSPRS